MKPSCSLIPRLLMVALIAPLPSCGESAAADSTQFVSHRIPNSGAPKLRIGYYVVSSAEELGAAAHREINAAPDFEKVRLAVLAPEFTSGSMHQELVGVRQNASEYVVQYRIHVPEIGTGDMAYPAILVEIPKDGREIRFEAQK